MAQVQIGSAFSGFNPNLAGALLDGGDRSNGDTTTPNGGTPTGGTPPTPAGQIIYGTPAQAYPTQYGMGYNPQCCEINWWWVLLAGIIGGVVGYVAGGYKRRD